MHSGELINPSSNRVLAGGASPVLACELKS